MTWENLLQLYLEEHRQAWRSPSSLYLMERWLGAFIGYCREHGAERMNAVRFELVRAYQQRLLWTRSQQGQLYSPNTVYQMLQMARAWLRWGMRRGHLDEDPTLTLVLPKPVQHEQRQLTAEEVQRILSLPDRRTPIGLRDLTLLSLIAQLRLTKQQLHRLDLADVQVRKQQLTLRRHAGPRVLDLGDLAELLSTYLWDARPALEPKEDELAVFLTWTGTRLGDAGIARVVQQHARQAGIEGNVSPRTLARPCRASCA